MTVLAVCLLALADVAAIHEHSLMLWLATPCTFSKELLKGSFSALAVSLLPQDVLLQIDFFRNGPCMLALVVEERRDVSLCVLFHVRIWLHLCNSLEVLYFRSFAFWLLFRGFALLGMPPRCVLRVQRRSWLVDVQSLGCNLRIRVSLWYMDVMDGLIENAHHLAVVLRLYL